MLTDDETTQLQFAIDAGDAGEVCRLIAAVSGDELTSLQLYGNSTVLMYALERGTPEVVGALLEKGTSTFELPWSDNNELKSAVRNKKHASAMTEMVLKMLPAELAAEMITSDWDPDEQPEGQARSAFQLAEKLKDPSVKQLLLQALDALKTR